MKTGADLSKWVDSLQSRGRYTFSREEAVSALKVSKIALKFALLRLVAKGRLIIPRRGFYVIVPLEYASTGTLPADWFIDDLMKFRRQPYYVGILSAAALHGAAHQQPQEFQVVTPVAMRPVRVKRTRIRFFVKSRLAETPTMSIKTTTGMIPVSTPEATVFDLVRYSAGAAGLDNVATVLSELSERIDPKALLAAAKKEPELATVQRAGYLLNRFGHTPVTGPLAQWLAKQKIGSVPLRPERNPKTRKIDSRWHVIVNEKIEPDL
jgi:predicted transcriptional regulator of viral defense system